VSGWSCPYLDLRADWCRRLDAACVLGRKGCVLPRNLRYAVPPEERVQEKNRKSSPSTTLKPRRSGDRR